MAGLLTTPSESEHLPDPIPASVAHRSPREKDGSQQRDCPGVTPDSLFITDDGEPIARAKVSIFSERCKLFQQKNRIRDMRVRDKAIWAVSPDGT